VNQFVQKHLESRGEFVRHITEELGLYLSGRYGPMKSEQMFFNNLMMVMNIANTAGLRLEHPEFCAIITEGLWRHMHEFDGNPLNETGALKYFMDLYPFPLTADRRRAAAAAVSRNHSSR
jgi:hypothetical protein